MISKIGQFKDPAIEKQIDEIVAKQFANQKEITVVFAQANKTVKADVGFRIDKFLPVYRNANISAWLVSSDDRSAQFQASGVGTMKFIVWKGDR